MGYRSQSQPQSLRLRLCLRLRIRTDSTSSLPRQESTLTSIFALRACRIYVLTLISVLRACRIYTLTSISALRAFRAYTLTSISATLSLSSVNIRYTPAVKPIKISSSSFPTLVLLLCHVAFSTRDEC